MQAILTFITSHPIFLTCINAVIIIAITYVVDRLVTKLLRRVLNSPATAVPASSIFINIARACIWLIGIGVLLRVCFNYDAAALIAALGVGGIAISLGFQDTLSNLIGGLQVSLGQLAKPGDYIEVLGQKGRVKDINWRETTLVDDSGVQFQVPNALMNKNVLTQLGNTYSVSVPFALPLTCDVETFTKDATNAVDKAVGTKLKKNSLRVSFVGEKSTGIEGTITAVAYRKSIGREKLIDAIVRAIDPVVKRAYAKDADASSNN